MQENSAFQEETTSHVKSNSSECFHDMCLLALFINIYLLFCIIYIGMTLVGKII